MSKNYVLWQQGLRGPTFTILSNRGDPPKLDEYERKHKIGDPVELPEGHSERLDELAQMYLCPPIKDEDQ